MQCTSVSINVLLMYTNIKYIVSIKYIIIIIEMQSIYSQMIFNVMCG